MDDLVPVSQRQQKFFELRTAQVQPPVLVGQNIGPIKINPRDLVQHPELNPNQAPVAPVGSPETGTQVPTNTPENLVAHAPIHIQQLAPDTSKPPVSTEVASNILDLLVRQAYVISLCLYPHGRSVATPDSYSATMHLQLPIVSEVIVCIQFIVSGSQMILQELTTDQIKQLFTTRDIAITKSSTVRAHLVFKDDPAQIVDLTGWDCGSADEFVSALKQYGENYKAELEIVARVNQSNRTMARFLLILQKEATAIVEWLKSFPTCLV